MPTTYAHYRFGCDALKAMPEEARNVVLQHRQLFDFGVHGPDLLFYDKPLTRSPVSELGYQIHQCTGMSFFSQGAKVVKASPEPEASLSYLLGVLCHFALDRESHPYVAKKEETGASHSEIEASFDRYLMKRDGLDPLDYKPTGHLIPSRSSTLIIAEFYPPLTGKDLYRAEKSMVLVLNTLATPPGVRRTSLVAAMKAAGKADLEDLLIPARQNLKCRDSDDILFDCYRDALTLMKEMVPELLEHIQDGSPLGMSFDHTFGEH